MTPCKVPNYYSHLGQRELVNWVRLALPENGTPFVVAINVDWSIKWPITKLVVNTEH